jgi:hypothetical protein
MFAYFGRMRLHFVAHNPTPDSTIQLLPSLRYCVLTIDTEQELKADEYFYLHENDPTLVSSMQRTFRKEFNSGIWILIAI